LFISGYLLPLRSLSRQQKSFDQFAFAANRHTGESLEPFADANFRLCVQPVREQAKLVCADAAALDTVE